MENPDSPWLSEVLSNKDDSTSNNGKYLNIPYGQSSAKLSVIWSLVTWSLGHSITQSFSHSVTQSLGHLVTWSLGHLVTRSLGHSVTW